MAKAVSAARRETGRRSSAHWRRNFLDALAQTSNVAASARRAGIDASTAYRLRRADTRFAAAWFEALCEGYDNLEMELLRRLREGELEGGTKSRARRRFDNATAFRLLAAHRQSVTRQRAQNAYEEEDAILASINAKLDRMRERARARPALLEADARSRDAD